MTGLAEQLVRQHVLRLHARRHGTLAVQLYTWNKISQMSVTPVPAPLSVKQNGAMPRFLVTNIRHALCHVEGRHGGGTRAAHGCEARPATRAQLPHAVEARSGKHVLQGNIARGRA